MLDRVFSKLQNQQLGLAWEQHLRVTNRELLFPYHPFTKKTIIFTFIYYLLFFFHMLSYPQMIATNDMISQILYNFAHISIDTCI